MGSLSLTNPLSGDVVTAGLHATNYTAIQTLINGGLDGTNMRTDIAIALGGLGISLGGDVTAYRKAANQFATDDDFYVFKTAGDANPQLALVRDFNGAGLPGIRFGAGGASTPDVAIFRSTADKLEITDAVKVDGAIECAPGAGDGFFYNPLTTAASAFTVLISGDGNSRFQILGTGKAQWGGGSSVPDVSIDRTSAGVLLCSGYFRAANGLQTLTVAGVVSDSSFGSVTPNNGTIAIDTTNSRIYVRIGGTWKSVTVA